VADRALVLGGGGVTGVAWELGLITGLAERGVRLAEADVVVGTSAGSSVGAQVLSGVPLERLYGAQQAGPGAELSARMSAGLLARYAWVVLTTRDVRTVGTRLGRLALRARTLPEADRRAAIAARLPVHDWPERARLLIPAVDAVTGELRVFDRDSGVPLVDAVAASCAVPGVWPPVTIGDRRYIDGGVRSPANADLAAGCDRIVVLAPAASGGGPVASVAAQVAALRAHASVVVVTRDAASRRAAGRNMLDPARRGPAARAGYAQAAAVAEPVAAVWAAP